MNENIKKNLLKIGIPVVGVVTVLIIAVVIITSVASGGIKGAIKGFYSGYINGNPIDTVNSIYFYGCEDCEDEFMDAAEDFGNKDKRERQEEIEELFGKGTKVKKIKITDEEKIKKDSDEYDEIIEMLEREAYWSSCDFDEDSIKEIRLVSYEIVIKGSENKAIYGADDMVFVKTAKGWQIPECQTFDIGRDLTYTSKSNLDYSKEERIAESVCQDNIKLIKMNSANYYAMYGCIAASNAEDLAFMFETGKIPQCPLGGEYTIVINSDGSATVKCPNESSTNNHQPESSGLPQ